MKKIAVTIISLTLASIIGLAGCREAAPVPVVPYEKEQTFIVTRYGVEKKLIAMDTGAVFEGYFTVKGRGDIRFCIKDPDGKKALDVTVQSRYDFSYTTTSEGPHLITIYFYNRSTTTKQVHLRWNVVQQS